MSKMILNEVLPVDLRKAVEADAEIRDVSLNDAAVRILCEHFDLQCEMRSGYRSPQADRFKLRVPDELHRAIRIEAAQCGLTARGVVLSLLSKHYGTEAIDPSRRPRRREVV